MLYELLVLAALGQAPSTQPARLAVAPTTRPAAAAPTTQPVVVSASPTTKPAAASYTGSLQLSDSLRVEVVGDQLMIMGTQDDLKLIEALVSRMEDAGPKPDIQLFSLRNADAEAIAQRVQSFWSTLQQGRTQSPEDRISIVADKLSNTIIVGATKTNMEKVGDIINAIEAAPSLTDNAMDWTPIELKHMPASQAAEIVRQTLEKMQKQKGVQGGRVDVQVAPHLNSLLIVAPQKDIEQIRRLIGLIDQEPSSEFGGVGRLVVFPLVNAEAESLAKTLDEMLKMEKQGDKALAEQIRRLRMAKQDPDGKLKDLPDLDLEKPVKILADKGMNAIIVGTTEKNILSLTEIVKLLDSLPVADEMLVKIFPLKHADVQNMAEVLQKLFDQGKKLPDIPNKTARGAMPEGVAGKAMAFNVNIATDPRTNTLLVGGRPEQVAFAQKIIDEMDIEGIGVKFPVQVLHVEHADPTKLGDMITKLNQQRIDTLTKRGIKSVEMERVFVVGDPPTESLIVSCTEENFKEIQGLLAKLDKAPASFLGDVHIVTLQNLTADAIGPKIEQLWDRRMQLKSKRGETYDEKPVIVTDARSNALVIASSKDDYLAIEQLVKQLEAQPLAPTAEIRMHVLQHNDSTKVSQMLEKLFTERAKMRLAKGQEEQPSDRVTIVTDEMSNSLLIACSRENYDEMVRLLSQVDAAMDVSGVIRLFAFQRADATRAAALIDDLFKKGIQRSGAANIPEAQRKISIVTDSRSNTLIVSATPENFSIVEALVKQVDAEEAPIFTPETQIFQLTNGDAVKVAGMMDKLFEGIKKSLPQEEQKEMNMTFLADDASNIVIATGSRYGMKRARDLLAKIDQQPASSSGEIKVYQLRHATAAKAASMMTELFEKRQAKGAGSADKTPLHIISDDGSNSVLITASRDDHGVVVDLLKLIDVPSILSQQMSIFPLQRAKADEIADTLTKVLEKQKGKEDAPFTVASEPRTNSIVVFAGPDMMSNIRTILDKLDSNRPAVELAMRVIQLKQAKAEDLSERLDEFMKKAAGEQSQERSLIINFKHVDRMTQQEQIRRLVHEDVHIEPDVRTNSLLVLAPADSIDMLESMVEMLDSVRPITAEIQMYRLRNADAEETQKLLEELFAVGQQGGSKSGAQGETERRLIFGAEGLAGAAAGAVTGSLELAFSIDKRTNTLIAAGSAEYLEIVERIVNQLDYLDVQNRTQRLVKLNYGVADNVAQTMEQYFQNEEKALESKDAQESTLRKMERQVTVQADEDSNTLLMSYSPRMETQVIELLNKLDQAPPQVMIKVLLAEVTLTDKVEMGMEFALQDLVFTEHATIGPNGTIQGSKFDVIGGTDVGAAGSGSLGGFSFTITGEDFNFLLRALQNEGRVDVLSRPSIMVADNQQANITVGSNVPVVQNLSIATGGIVQPSVTYRDVGIILDVEPHINPDGYVNMNIRPEISDIATSSVSIGSGINLPIFTQRSADTWVSVRDGETIVIGGLITSRENNSEAKVPVAGDVPLLGNLFRSTVRDKSKTELLIVLTPEIIRTEQEAHKVSISARDQTGLLDRIRMNPLMEKLQVKPEDDKFGPIDKEMMPTTRPAGDRKSGKGENGEFGPDLDIYGPEASAAESTISVAGVPAAKKAD